MGLWPCVKTGNQDFSGEQRHKERTRLNIRRSFPTARVVKLRDGLARQVVGSPLPQGFGGSVAGSGFIRSTLNLSVSLYRLTASICHPRSPGQAASRQQSINIHDIHGF